MESELGSENGCSGHSKGYEPAAPPDPVCSDFDDSDWLDRCYVSRVRPSEANGFLVYTRTKRFKSARVGVSGSTEKLQGDSRDSAAEDGTSKGIEASGNVGAAEVERRMEEEGEMMEIEVKQETAVGRWRSSRSVFKVKEEKIEVEDEGDLRDAVILEEECSVGKQLADLSSSETRKMEMKMSKKILVKGRPTTVRELFETGLLEGYPVFYNGGRRGFPLRGTIKDSGILCSCILCRGTRVVPPCQFEIHACRTYRRASQYICLENGKSLLDVVKECRKSTVKSLEETIINFVGPLPVKVPVICSECGGSFLATSNVKMELLCDSCMIAANTDFDVECVKSRPLEPLLGLTGVNGKMQDIPQQKGCRGRKKRKHLELATTAKPKIALLGRKKKNKWKIKNRLLPPASAILSPNSTSVTRFGVLPDPTPNVSVSLCDSLKNKARTEILKKLSNTTSLLKSIKDDLPSQSRHLASKITKKDQRMHRMVFENGGLPDGTEVAYYSNGKKLRDGYKMGSGIICRCCSTLVSPSQFEGHAGWASRRKPYMYIYTSNGVSLHEYALSLSKGRKSSSKDNDDLCIICRDGGKLVLCDGCPRSFHKECASLLSIPRGKWYCTYCQNMFQREKFLIRNANAAAAGRISGVDPVEQVTDRCIRVVKNPEETDGYDFSKSGFGPRTVILCDQCEKEYHVGCLKKCKLADLKELPKGKWFCSANCKWIHAALQNLLEAGEEKLPDSSFDIFKKNMGNNPGPDTNLDVRWRLLSGKVTSLETRVLLSQAVAIFHECFDPIVDPETGRDFIPSFVYGRNIRGQDFSGMHCAILTVNSTVVSAGIVRIFGEEIAELPLAATRNVDQGKGFFQLLYSCIEKLLAFLNVKSLVLPAAEDAKSIWIEKFGFGKMPLEQLMSYRRTCWQMISFKGTSMLEKPVPKCRIINQTDTDDDPDLPME